MFYHLAPWVLVHIFISIKLKIYNHIHLEIPQGIRNSEFIILRINSLGCKDGKTELVKERADGGYEDGQSSYKNCENELGGEDHDSQRLGMK